MDKWNAFAFISVKEFPVSFHVNIKIDRVRPDEIIKPVMKYDVQVWGGVHLRCWDKLFDQDQDFLKIRVHGSYIIWSSVETLI